MWEEPNSWSGRMRSRRNAPCPGWLENALLSLQRSDHERGFRWWLVVSTAKTFGRLPFALLDPFPQAGGARISLRCPTLPPSQMPQFLHPRFSHSRKFSALGLFFRARAFPSSLDKATQPGPAAQQTGPPIPKERWLLNMTQHHSQRQ